MRMPLTQQGTGKMPAGGGDESQLKISVLLPVYSETQCLIDAVEQVRQYAGENLLEIILVVAPASIPETFTICGQLAKTYDTIRVHIQKKAPGVGWAVREGFELARGSHVLLAAADGETDLSIVPAMIEKLRKTGCDIVTANRWAPEGGFTGYDPLKLVLNWIFQQTFKVLLRTRLHDLTYGYRLFDTSLVRRIRWEYTRHEFLFETIAKPIRLGCRIEEVPVKWSRRSEGATKNTFFRNFHYFRVGLKVCFSRRESLLIDGNAGRD
jgi:glycosyltransferase involved in cell wall biosynthesis